MILKRNKKEYAKMEYRSISESGAKK